MNPSTKQVIVVSQTSVTNAGTAAGNIDTIGYDYVSIDVITSTSNDTTNNPSVLKVAEDDGTVTSNFTDITEFVGDDSDGWTIPASVTSGNWGVKFNIDLRARKRYLRVSVSPLTTQVITVIANLSKHEIAPIDATKSGVKALVEG